MRDDARNLQVNVIQKSQSETALKDVKMQSKTFAALFK